MAIIDLVKWNGSPNLLAWKFPSEELSTWTQLVVNESQEAYLVRGGVYEGPFGAGRHTLSTENLPLLRTVIGVPFGGKSPFTAEVWYVNRVTNLDVRWGTPDSIQLQDPKYGVMVPVRAFGQYGIRITEPKKFLLKLVGTLPGFDADTLSEYFRGVFITRIKTEIANAITRAGISVLEISTQLEALSEALKTSLSIEMAEYGVGLAQFNIHSINVPEDDPAVKTLKGALAKRAEMGIIGFTYQQERSFNVMETAAGNEGAAGTLMGAGIGVGAGIGMAPAFGQGFAQATQHFQQPAPPPAAAPVQAPAQAAPAGASQPAGGATGQGIGAAERIRLLKELAELKAAGILSDSEVESEKQKILAS
ncbi:SPFH domain-containing protein [Paraburkholderia sp. CNPSo 3274]|uniref:SPFH domain-containing protein n=1 Tax=Paraburkholderia sp. CNPSo 3274 TaxID=2940932 RepID=UPI0020B6C651|nr:SPFH domain-containing protein [Paraburkholderia sp. CNPSo 3274]MCP3711501.1 SPFH domain-containing protein [Paraburkholderia sp. CNPSo 3274]